MASDPNLKHAGADNRARRSHYEAALDRVSDAVIATDASRHIIYLNAAAATLTGWARNEALGKPLTSVFLPTTADEPLPSLSDLTSNGLPIQATLVDLKGVEREIEFSESFTLELGNVSGVVIVARDVTRRRAAEVTRLANERSLVANADALFAERERAQVTLNSIGDAVISTDFRGVVTYLNIVAETMTGWTQAEATGLPIDTVFKLAGAEDRQVIACPATRAIIENHTVAVEVPCVLIRRDGVALAVENSASPIHDKQGGVVGAVIVAHDVTAARELSSKLARLALHDSLTDLPNRTLFRERMALAMARARVTGTSIAIMYVDLDRFKHINDSLGHNVGDLLLQRVAQEFLGCVRSSDTVSRLGGDEFVLMLADLHKPRGCGALRGKDPACAQCRILHCRRPIDGDGQHWYRDVPRPCRRCRHAAPPRRCRDVPAKYSGRGNYQMFSSDMNTSA